MRDRWSKQDMRIAFDGDDPLVDARLVAQAFSLTPERVMAGLRDGSITTMTERGTGEDAGRWRLTFFHDNCRMRLIVDETGTVLQHSRVDFGETPLPPAMRRPGD
jgi:hypothetical protein